MCKNDAAQMQCLEQQLDEARQAIEAMQRECSRGKEMQGQYAVHPEIQGLEDEAEVQMVEQILQYKREVGQLREITEQQVSWRVIA